MSSREEQKPVFLDPDIHAEYRKLAERSGTLTIRMLVNQALRDQLKAISQKVSKQKDLFE